MYGLKLGVSTETIKTALEEVRVPGRSELVDNKKDLNIMIDYAHSPESLENILSAVSEYTPRKGNFSIWMWRRQRLWETSYNGRNIRKNCRLYNYNVR